MQKNKIIERVTTYGKMIKFSHTLFALPFALSAAVLAAKKYSINIVDILLIITAMAGARSAAMGFNRIVDAKIDKKNIRTKNREIPSGELSSLSVFSFILISSFVFIISAYFLSKQCFYLSFPALAILFFYSYTKRFTWLCHIFLGFGIGLAPIGAWLSIAKSFSFSITPLSMALLTYIAGFDILYSLMDIDFDKKEKLFSIPSRFGVKRSLYIARFLHFISFCFLFSLYFIFNMGYIYIAAFIIIGGLFIAEHMLIKKDNLKYINIAFFHVNSAISIILFLGILIDSAYY
jgi:4-hydroxybenzoate polyprenyltransferase